MSYYRFKDTDIFTNVLRTNPSNNFLIYSGSVFYRNTPYESGSVFFGNVTHVPVGSISLYELNVDRAEGDHDYDYDSDTGTKTMIHPWIVKSGNGVKFKSISTGSYNQEDYGTTMTSSFNYPLSASLSRELYPANHLASALNYSARKNVQLSPQTYKAFNYGTSEFDKGVVTVSSSYIEALKNTLNHYTPLSDHYAFTSSAKANSTPLWDKGIQSINMINIPSIYYGKSIKKGTVNLKFYISGSIAGECADIYENGELVEVSGAYDRFSSGSVAGVVLYNEGIVLLTGSWDLSADSHTEPYSGVSASPVAPSWLYWGVGITSSLNVPGTSQLGSIAKPSGDTNYNQSLQYNIVSSSFSFDFEGIEDVPVKTMLAHAPRGELYYSNNPTFTTSNSTGSTTTGIVSRPGLGTENRISGSVQNVITGSTFYIEDDSLEIKNINSSSFPNHTASFEKITYISKIGLYDDQKNLIGIAKVARPVKKTVDRDLTFKLKLDI